MILMQTSASAATDCGNGVLKNQLCTNLYGITSTREEKMKLFQIGLNKTGTTSLHEAMQILGYRSIHDVTTTATLIEEIKSGKTDLLNNIDAFTCFYDDFRFLKEHLPDAKFVLTTRDKNEWIQSRIFHVLSNRATGESDWRDIDSLKWEKEFDDHHSDVRGIFRDDPNFLEMDICGGDGWKQLCPFLDCPIPDVAFPISHTHQHKLNNIGRYLFSTDWFSRRIPRWERRLAHLKDKPIKALEIGSYEGRSAVWLIENILTNPESTLTCVDVWNDRDVESRFDHNILTTGHSIKVKKTRAESHRALRWMPMDYYNLIYIDASHEGLNVLEDAVLSFRLLKKHGILIFDDYLWKSEKRNVLPKPAIDAFLSMYAHRIKVLHIGYQAIIRRCS